MSVKIEPTDNQSDSRIRLSYDYHLHRIFSGCSRLSFCWEQVAVGRYVEESRCVKNANLEPRRHFVVCSSLSVMSTIAKFKRAEDERGLDERSFLDRPY